MSKVSSSIRVVAGNAIANILRVGLPALLAIAIPPVLTRSLPVATFGVWGLILQLGAYVGVLDFGLQVAVGRYVAYYNEVGDHKQRDRIVSTAFAALLSLGAIGLAGSLIIAWQLPLIFPQMPSGLYSEARLALLLVSGSLAFSLPFGTFNSIFTGLQRNEIPTALVVVGKLVSGVLVILAARFGGGLFWMALGMSAANVATALAQYWACRWLVAEIRFSIKSVSRDACRELYGYCLSLSVWSIAMLLVSGLSITIVAILDFRSVAYFTVAVALTNFLAGLQNAAFNALIPVAAAMGARQDAQKLGDVLIASTRYGTLILLLTGLPLIICSALILQLWVGIDYALHARPFLQVLVAANMIRLSATPYAVLLIGTGQQRKVILTPLIEGGTNLISGILLGARLGAIGVAWGALVGAVVGVMCNFIYNMRRTNSIAFMLPTYFKTGILLPVGASLPVIPLCVGLLLLANPVLAVAVIISSAGLLAVSLWLIAISPGEQVQILRFLASKRSISRRPRVPAA